MPAGAGAVVVCSLEVPLDTVTTAVEGARERGWAVVPPAPARPLPVEVLAAGVLLTPDQHELSGLGAGGPEDLLDAGAAAVVVTRGHHGADLHTPCAVRHVDGCAVAAVDTTGAGDAFNGALATAVAAGRPLEDAVRFANAAGALATTGTGARGGLTGPEAVCGLLEPRGAQETSASSSTGGQAHTRFRSP